MLIYEEIKSELEKIKINIHDLKNAIDFDNTSVIVNKLEQKTMEPNFWNDKDDSQKILNELSKYRSKITSYNKIIEDFETVEVTFEIATEEETSLYDEEVLNLIEKLKKAIETLRLSALLNGEYDSLNVIITLHAGAGGTEAQDWVEMLYRMYNRYAEKNGYKVKVIDFLDGDEAGIKSASILVEGLNAYGYLKSESGVHRLVRISPFDSSGRRHTSFAAVEVMPEITDIDGGVEIDMNDLKIDTFRAGGAGGQHVNVTDSAVRITHIPTGLVASCQNERSQHQNKDVAMKLLLSKLAKIKEKEHLEKIEDIKGVQNKIEWGSQIRSYVFMPYTMVKDHRTSFETGNIDKVMDGEIDDFINEYLKFNSKL